VQFLPPFDGGGVLQLLVWVRIPRSQVLLHVVHADHGDQFPSLTRKI
jgi:hypothetical protein